MTPRMMDALVLGSFASVFGMVALAGVLFYGVCQFVRRPWARAIALPVCLLLSWVLWIEIFPRVGFLIFGI